MRKLLIFAMIFCLAGCSNRILSESENDVQIEDNSSNTNTIIAEFIENESLIQSFEITSEQIFTTAVTT